MGCQPLCCGLTSAPRPRSAFGRALAKPNRPVSGWGQGRQPPEAVARSASLEAGRSPGYFKNTVAPRRRVPSCHRRPWIEGVAAPGRAAPPPTNLTPATGARTTRLRRPRPPSQKPAGEPGTSPPKLSRQRFSAFVGAPPDRSRAVRPPCNCHARPTLPRPPHPASTSVTIAIRPSQRGGTSGVINLILADREAIYFSRGD